MRHHIVFFDRATIAAEIIVRPPAFKHVWQDYPQTAPEQVVERAKEATVLVDNKVPIRAEILEQLPALRMIAVAATGTDCIDKPWCADHSIVVSNIRYYAVSTVPEHTFALILALKRSLLGYHRDVVAGMWQQSDEFSFFTHPISELQSDVLGIIGEGSTGQAVAALGKAFGMRTLFATHKRKTGLGPFYRSFDGVITASDVITLHCPLPLETTNIIVMSELQRMKRTAILINTARGGLINESDLATALRYGLIAGAATRPQSPPWSARPSQLHPDLARCLGEPRYSANSRGSVDSTKSKASRGAHS